MIRVLQMRYADVRNFKRDDQTKIQQKQEWNEQEKVETTERMCNVQCSCGRCFICIKHVCRVIFVLFY